MPDVGTGSLWKEGGWVDVRAMQLEKAPPAAVAQQREGGATSQGWEWLPETEKETDSPLEKEPACWHLVFSSSDS